jgi:hypothetical protein
MPPIRVNAATPPEDYDSTYCAGVQALCSAKMESIATQVSDVHGAVFGSKEQPGMMALLTKKVSITSVKWVVAVFGLPALLACLALYAFYIRAPLVYVDKQEHHILSEKVVKMEERIDKLPDTVMMKQIMREVLTEHK